MARPHWNISLMLFQAHILISTVIITLSNGWIHWLFMASGGTFLKAFLPLANLRCLFLLLIFKDLLSSVKPAECTCLQKVDRIQLYGSYDRCVLIELSRLMVTNCSCFITVICLTEKEGRKEGDRKRKEERKKEIGEFLKGLRVPHRLHHWFIILQSDSFTLSLSLLPCFNVT